MTTPPVLLIAILAVPLVGCITAFPAPNEPQNLRVEDAAFSSGARGQGSFGDIAQSLDGAGLVCIGEQHDNPAHHRFQLAILETMLERAQSSGREIAIGMEMFPRAFQPALDDYVSGRISEQELLHQTNWERTWGYDESMYAPLWRKAHDYGLRLLALNAPRSLTRQVARHGLDSLPEQVRDSLPELNLSDQDHQRFFTAAMGGDSSSAHAGAQTAKSSFYLAQVIWDETMASSAAAWLAVDPQRRQILIIAGNGHCHDSAIVRRVERRLTSVNGLSVIVKSDDSAVPDEIKSDFVVTIKTP